jgi:hypothetical protein
MLLSEAQIQAAVMQHWETFGLPGTLVAAVPNAHAHGQPGLTRGLFDLVCFSPRLGERTGWLELKTDRGKLSTAQCDFRDLVRPLGVPFAVTYGRDDPIAWLERWGLVRRTNTLGKE